jgi:hypothetical protein
MSLTRVGRSRAHTDVGFRPRQSTPSFLHILSATTHPGAHIDAHMTSWRRHTQLAEWPIAPFTLNVARDATPPEQEKLTVYVPLN